MNTADSLTARQVAALVKEWVAGGHGLRQALAEEGLVLFKKKPGYHYASKGSREARKVVSPLEHQQFAALAKPLLDEGRTPQRVYTLFQALENVASGSEAELVLLEVGVYKGATSHFIAGVMNALAPGRARLIAVDTFSGHRPEDFPDGLEGAHMPGTFDDTSLELVSTQLEEFGFVEVVEGRIQDVAASIGEEEFHFAHVDVDIYAPTLFTLRFLNERLAPGGAILIDDYGFVTCPGVTRAVDEFLSDKSDRFFKLALETGQCCLVATGES